MPRITYMQPETSLGLSLTDLAGGVLGGYMQGQAANLERDRQQQEQAFGNPYQQRARRLAWGAMPAEVTGSSNAALYQQMIMSGADPTTILNTHKQLDTDPAYGDARTQKARQQEYAAAVRGGLVKGDDAASLEAFRRGELSLGELIKSRNAAGERKAQRKDEQDARKAEQTDEQTALRARAGQVQRALGVGQGSPQTPFFIPQGIGGVEVQIPEIPGQQFDHPSDVEAVARTLDSRANTAADNARDARRLALQQRHQEVMQAIAAAKAQGVQMTPQDEDVAVAHLEALNDPEAPETRKDRARIWLKQKKLIGESAMLDRPSAEESAAHADALRELDRLGDIQRAFSGPNGLMAMQQYAQAAGIQGKPMTRNGKPVLGPDGQPRTGVDENAVIAHLTAAIQAAQQRVDAARRGLRPGGGPAAAPPPHQMTRAEKEAALLEP